MWCWNCTNYLDSTIRTTACPFWQFGYSATYLRSFVCSSQWNSVFLLLGWTFWSGSSCCRKWEAVWKRLQVTRKLDHDCSRKCNVLKMMRVLLISKVKAVVQSYIGQANGLSLSVSHIIHPLSIECRLIIFIFIFQFLHTIFIWVYFFLV